MDVVFVDLFDFVVGLLRFVLWLYEVEADGGQAESAGGVQAEHVGGGRVADYVVGVDQRGGVVLPGFVV